MFIDAASGELAAVERTRGFVFFGWPD